MTDRYVSRRVAEEAVLLSKACESGDSIHVYANNEGGWCEKRGEVPPTTDRQTPPEMIIKTPLLKGFGNLMEISKAVDEFCIVLLTAMIINHSKGQV